MKTALLEKQGMQSALFGIFCAILVGAVTWAADSNSPRGSLGPDPANSCYNLLVRGFKSGQLNMKIDSPPGLAKLSNPYDPAQNGGLTANFRDLTYFKGKFYLYFGVTPALVLLWPWETVTGHYLSDRCAIAIIFAFGFLAIWAILCAVRRYFPESSFGAFAPGILISGLIVGLTLFGSPHIVATVSGFTFAMLALAGIWYALDRPARRNRGLLLASLFYGLAAGARQSLVFGAVILLAPVLQARISATGSVSRRQTAVSFLSAIGPIALIGIGMMVYNDLRFGSLFEFGRRYQLTGDYDPTTAKQFSLHYIWFNIRYYFLEPVSVNGHFPFLQDFSVPGTPMGHDPTPEDGSLLFGYPFILFIFAVPLIWRKRPVTTISALNWFIGVLFLLFAVCALTDCLFLADQPYYELDFLPALILLSFIGFLGMDGLCVHSPGLRWIVRIGWYGLLGCSLVFNSLMNVKARAFSNFDAGAELLNRYQPDDAVKYLKNAVSLEPRVAMYHDQLANAYAYSKTRHSGEAVSEFRTALKIDPHFTRAEYDLGDLLYRLGQQDEAYKYLKMALGADPTHSNFNYAFVNIVNAWLLVSSPDPGKRNGPLAVNFAEAACQETGYKNAHTLVVSAEVFAQTGQTNEAISLAQRAVAVANQDGESNLLDMAKSVLTRYSSAPGKAIKGK